MLRHSRAPPCSGILNFLIRFLSSTSALLEVFPNSFLAPLQHPFWCVSSAPPLPAPLQLCTSVLHPNIYEHPIELVLNERPSYHRLASLIHGGVYVLDFCVALALQPALLQLESSRVEQQQPGEAGEDCTAPVPLCLYIPHSPKARIVHRHFEKG